MNFLEKEQMILRKTYHDRLTAYRSRISNDPETGEDSFREEKIYENVPCALSVSSRKAGERGGIMESSDDENTIFTGPDVQLEHKDHVVITTESGQIYDGYSGKTYIVRNHGETTLKVDRMV